MFKKLDYGLVAFVLGERHVGNQRFSHKGATNAVCRSSANEPMLEVQLRFSLVENPSKNANGKKTRCPYRSSLDRVMKQLNSVRLTTRLGTTGGAGAAGGTTGAAAHGGASLAFGSVKSTSVPRPPAASREDAQKP